MKAKSKLLVVPLLLSLGALFLVWQWVSAIPESAMHTAVHQPTPSAHIDSALLSAISESLPDQPLRFILYLSAKADLATLPENLSADDRRAELVSRLQTTAVTSQSPLITELETAKQTGTIQTYRPLWIVNAIAVSGTAVAIQTLATRPEIAEIRLDTVVDSFQPPEENQLLALLQEGEWGNGPIRSWGIERIQAPHVWHGLGIDGTGVTVGIMDTGVDFLHPDLVNSYRGNLGNGNFEHTGNWYNANIPTNTIPNDTYGHGTHVAGTAVGANGIGVAPGAQWIAVNIASPFGYIFTSDAHVGFQWLLAPNNDPAAAPDVVNASWSGPGYSQEFLPDVVALQTSGIIPVFAAGNAGPFTATVGSPASYPGTLSIGASDDIDEVAWFSSLGPSLLTSEIKPWIIAPGTQILSALPGNLYGYYNGTSMSTPHTVGTIALLLSANPTLTESEIKQTMADTAVPISTTHPNMVSGWGRLDAYTAVQTQVPTGRLLGTVLADGLPLPHAAITITTASGASLAYQSDANGHYEAALRSGNYAVTVSLFGFVVYQSAPLTVQTNQNTVHTITLTRLPGGTVTGIVRDAHSQLPLANAIVQLDGQSLQTITGSDGRYTLILPAGTHNLTVRAHAYRLGHASVTLTVGQTRTQEFSLASGPTVLLVDSGQWYFRSKAAYYQGSMTALGYPLDTWTIRHPAYDVPTDADLADYDAVIWSSPSDSPGFLGANNVITNYLGIGGNLFLSGQNVGAYDGYGFGTQLYWYRYLDANFLGKTWVTHTIQGAENSPFAGLSLTLNDGSSANNQASPDVSEPIRDSMTQDAFVFDDGRAAGLLSGHCQPGRMVYTGFGLEGVTDSADRQAILQRSLDYFATPLTTVGVRFLPAQVNDFAVPGDHMVYTLTVHNLSETLTDTFSLTAVNEGWPTSLLTSTVTLGPCDASHTVLNLDIPPNLPKNTYHTVRVTAVSGNNPAASNVSLIHHKTPGQILFVDDDRWYDEDRHLTNGLDAMGLEYDVWETGWKDYDRRNSPPTNLLHEYDFIIWYTGYDWFAPILPNEAQSLAEYLAQGGRLFLTSQDFLYYNANTELSRHYLGVMDYRESVTPTVAYGGNHQAIADNLAGPLALSLGRYQNNGDGLIPQPTSQPFFWHDSGMPAGVATAGSTWRSVFWGVPFENLPDEAEAAAMNHIMGWLSDLGDSAFEVDERVATAQSGFGFAVSTRTYTITLQNTPLAPDNQIWMFNNLPDELRLVPGSLTGGATYHPAGWLTWQGTLPSGGRHQIVYQAVPIQPLPPGTAVTNTISIYYNRHDLAFERTAVYWADTPDLSDSTFTAVPNQPNSANQIAYLLTLRNTGLAAASAITTNMRLPDDLTVLSSTLLATGGTTWADGRRIFWQGSLQPGQSVIIRIIATRENIMEELWLPATAVIQDGVTSTLLKEQILHLPPYKQYFPITVRN